MRKNLYPLNGIPLIAYTIKAAQASRLDDFIVTTDDDEIATYSRSMGCKVVREPAMGQGEPGAIVKSVQYAVAEYEAHWESPDPDDFMHVDAVCLLQPTSPLRTAEDIDAALQLWKVSEAYSLISVHEGGHPMKAYVLAKTRRPRLTPMVQYRTPYDKHKHPCYTRNGAIFVTSRAVLDNGELWDDQPTYVEMEKAHAVDIDNYDDLKIAEALLKAGVVS